MFKEASEIQISGSITTRRYNQSIVPLWQGHTDNYPDSKVHGANMGPIWGRKTQMGPCWPHELCYLGIVSDYLDNAGFNVIAKRSPLESIYIYIYIYITSLMLLLWSVLDCHKCSLWRCKKLVNLTLPNPVTTILDMNISSCEMHEKHANFRCSGGNVMMLFTDIAIAVLDKPYENWMDGKAEMSFSTYFTYAVYRYNMVKIVACVSVIWDIFC